MITKLRKIGNSSGIIISKSLIEQCEITDRVKISVKDKAIVLEPVKKLPRSGWEEKFIKAGSLNDKESLLTNLKNKFDEEEWTW